MTTPAASTGYTLTIRIPAWLPGIAGKGLMAVLIFLAGAFVGSGKLIIPTIHWPGPTPAPAPTPVVPPPIPSPGLRVLMLYESADLTKYPAAQASIIYDQSLRIFLDGACAKGADGKSPEYRIWDKDVIASGDSPLWQTALARPHPTMPWIVVSNGITGYEGPLPGNAADTLALVKKYATPAPAPAVVQGATINDFSRILDARLEQLTAKWSTPRASADDRAIAKLDQILARMTPPTPPAPATQEVRPAIYYYWPQQRSGSCYSVGGRITCR